MKCECGRPLVHGDPYQAPKTYVSGAVVLTLCADCVAARAGATGRAKTEPAPPVRRVVQTGYNRVVSPPRLLSRLAVIPPRPVRRG